MVLAQEAAASSGGGDNKEMVNLASGWIGRTSRARSLHSHVSSDRPSSRGDKKAVEKKTNVNRAERRSVSRSRKSEKDGMNTI
jgi:hypothetical protein